MKIIVSQIKVRPPLIYEMIVVYKQIIGFLEGQPVNPKTKSRELITISYQRHESLCQYHTIVKSCVRLT